MQSIKEAMKQAQERIKNYQASQVGKLEESDQTEKRYDCPKCKDEQGVIVERDGVEFWQTCSCVAQKKIERLFRSSEVTEEFRKKSLRNFDVEKRPQIILDAFDTATEYVELFDSIKHDRQNSIALLGIPGTGKTHLLMGIANELMQSGVGVLYFPWVEGFNDLVSDLDLVNEKVNRLQKAPVLYIDDLFKGRKEPTEFQKVQFFAIVNYRYLNHLPILVSSEWDFDEICGLDMGSGSRLYEMCKDYTVIIKGGVNLNYRLNG